MAIQKLTDEEYGTKGGSIAVCQAVFQADSVMAYRMVNHDTDILLTSDSDQAALLGHECVSVKSYKFKQGKKQHSKVFRYLLQLIVHCKRFCKY
jgi:hypothetical protein